MERIDIDDLFRDELEDQHLPYDDSSWEEAATLLAKEERRRAAGGWFRSGKWLGVLALLLFLGGGIWYGSNTTTSTLTHHNSVGPTESELSSPQENMRSNTNIEHNQEKPTIENTTNSTSSNTIQNNHLNTSQNLQSSKPTISGSATTGNLPASNPSQSGQKNSSTVQSTGKNKTIDARLPSKNNDAGLMKPAQIDASKTPSDVAQGNILGNPSPASNSTSLDQSQTDSALDDMPRLFSILGLDLKRMFKVEENPNHWKPKVGKLKVTPTKEKAKPYLTCTALVGFEHTLSYHLPDSSPYHQKRDTQESNAISPSYSFLATLNWKNWGLSTGLGYREVARNTNYINAFPKDTFNLVTQYFYDADSPNVVLQTFNIRRDTQMLVGVDEIHESKLKSTYKASYFEIPLQLSYTFGKKRLQFGLFGGVNLGILHGTSGYVLKEDNSPAFAPYGSETPMTKLIWSGVAGYDVKYRLTPKLGLVFRGQYRYTFSDLHSGGTMKTNPFSGLGLYLGVQGRF